jgi:NitT/TauT family transport system ATP-binding protein
VRGPPEPVATPIAASGRVHVALADIRQVFQSTTGGPAVHALGPLSLALTAGEFFSLVGPSGCGKSTLLEIIAGLIEPTAGTVTIDGKEVRGSVPDGVGVVFQEDASFPWLSVWDNIAFGLKRIGLAANLAKARVDARTLVMEPRLILLDEPFGALDQQTRLLMGDEVLNLWRATNATVVLITHALDEAAMLSDRVGVMSARPGRFIEIVTTGWERDRDSRIVTSERFGAVTAHLWTLLRDESIKAIR